jgi:hypothetical protein
MPDATGRGDLKLRSQIKCVLELAKNPAGAKQSDDHTNRGRNNSCIGLRRLGGYVLNNLNSARIDKVIATAR